MTNIYDLNFLEKNDQNLTPFEQAIKINGESIYTDDRTHSFMIRLRGPPPLKNSLTQDKPISNKKLIVRFFLTD